MITEAILQTIFGKMFDGLNEKLEKVKEEIKPKDVQSVRVVVNPDSFSYTEVDKSTTIKTSWGTKNEADMIFKNNLKKESKVKEISMIPNTAFKTKGKVMITIDDVPVFLSKSFTAFEDAIDSKIKVNKTISQNSKVKFFLISSDGTSVGLTGQVTFSDE